MALIQCPKCQNDISEKAMVCPHCGYTIENDDNTNKKPLFAKIIICAIALVLLIGIIAAAVIGFKHNADKQKAIQLNNEISQIGEIVWKTENEVDLDKFSQEAKEAFINKDKITDYLNKLYDLQSQYDTMNENQKSYVTDYNNLKKGIEAFERKQKTFQIKDDLEKSIEKTEKAREDFNKYANEVSATPSPTNNADEKNVIHLEPYTIKITRSFVSSDKNGNKVIVMNINYTNSSSEAKTFRQAINLTLYQDGIQLEQCYQAKNYDMSSGLNTKVKDGASLDVQMAYYLRSTSIIDFEMNRWEDYSKNKRTGTIKLTD